MNLPNIIFKSNHTPSGATFNASTTRLVSSNPIYCTADKRSYVYFIAHRMRTVANADKIVVLSGGCVAESGAPQELEAKQGVYAHMLQTQKDTAAWTL